MHCGAQRANQPPGVLCTQRKGHGTPHPGIGRCSRHGGSTPPHVAAAAAELARRACVTLGVSVAIDPAEALLNEVRRSYGNVLFYEQLVAQLPTHPAADTTTPAPTEGEGQEGEGEATTVRGAIGVYGPIYHASGEATGESRAHVLVTLYNDERKHLARVAAAALSAGVAQRAIELAEDVARQVAEVLTAFARELGLDPSAPEVRKAGRDALQLVAGGGRR